ncbi:histidine--tRNA ligase [Desulfofundulus thermocisternus]|uniref:histidine--tRNA ligase n=1 Tax=Desulfofundulus thermocisternus TaxID=42471 RepID=UPI0019F75244|nr:histidine--tRNA ligase [Desulfofundulus thermocisternus]MBE3584764.1 histidine--tRNA ligase [Thermoanaerobacter sp.]MCS5694863.1 histidine--tRNA ligase [Desulfofundulus thermocisternus]
MLTTRPRGTSDILPGEVEKWQYLEQVIYRLCREYGYSEIRTPIFEHTELFERGVGETTDIVQKEMYTFLDRGGRSITLRPEGTAAVVRAYLENKLYAGLQPVKLYYTGPMFRYDRPQAGRYRQFTQFGVEVLGSHDPALDAEVITMAMDFYGRLGLKNLNLLINSVGCPRCRPVLREKLQDFFRARVDRLCSHCRGRLERNPLRILDCKEERCREAGKDAPTSLDYLCPDCEAHFQAVLKQLEKLGVAFTVNRSLVRGLDYYTNTAFEITVQGIGAQNSIGGGGRYNGLVKECGGPDIPGIGFALGLERVLLTMEQQGIVIPRPPKLDVFLAAADEAARDRALVLVQRLRQEGLAVDMDYLGRSLKSQMKYAGKLGVGLVVILGSDELERGVVTLRNMSAGSQREIPLDRLAGEVRQHGLKHVSGEGKYGN